MTTLLSRQALLAALPHVVRQPPDEAAGVRPRLSQSVPARSGRPALPVAPASAERLFLPPPVGQCRQLLLKIGSGLLRRPALVRHMPHQKIRQRPDIGIGEFSIGIAPPAVCLVEAAVRLTADGGIVVERHTAALADQLSGRAQKRVDGNVEQL